jgi:RHS repeat-associated protein
MRSLHFGCPAAALARFAFPLALVATLALSGTAWSQVGPSGAQGIAASGDQSGVNFDGTSGGCGGPVFSIPRNPEEPGVPGVPTIDQVFLATGGVSLMTRSLDYNAEIPWVIGESFNALQVLSSSHHDSDRYQGIDWFQTSAPELIDDTGNGKVHLLYAADKYVTYQQIESSTLYAGIEGAGGFFQVTSAVGSEPDLWKFTDMTGRVSTFIGFGTNAGDEAGQLWKIESLETGANAYVGANTSVQAARAAGGWAGSGRISVAYDSSGRKFVYDYTSGRLDSVAVLVGTTEVGRVEYTYYDGVAETANGLSGDLRTVKRVTPMSDSAALEQVKYYRYYVADSAPGFEHAIKLVLDYEGARQFDWQDATFNGDYFSANDDALKPYAQAYFEYHSDRRVSLARFNGQCGCSGGGASGTYTFTYGVNSSYSDDGSAYDTEWHRRVVVGRPDGSYLTQYFDDEGQTLSTVISDGDPAVTSPSAPTYWCTQVVRDDYGGVKEIWTPDSISGYDHSTGAFTADTTGGLVRRYERATSGFEFGYVTQAGWFDSAAPSTSYVDFVNTWNTSTAVILAGGQNFVRPLLASRQVLVDNEVPWGTPTGGNTTTYSYEVHVGQKFAVRKVSETQPTVSTSKNGSGAAHQVHRIYRADGQLAFVAHKPFEVSDAQIIERRTYTANAQLSAVYEDANTSGVPGLAGWDSEFASATGAINDSETWTYDAQGRVVTHETHGGQKTFDYWTLLADRRVAHLSFPHHTTSSGTEYAMPARYSVSNHAGKPEFTATVGADQGDYISVTPANFIDEAESDPITAVSATVGKLRHVRTTLYDKTGSRASESLMYFLTPTSGKGADGTNYDPTLFHYDGMGRLIRRKEAHGTIYRTVYDARGLATQSWIGTNDNGLPGGPLSGTNDMVQTDATSYDVNGWVTSRSAYTESTTSTGEQSTIYHLDVRGRAIATVRPTAPHTVRKFDNLGRVIMTAEYSSSSELSVASDPDEDEDDRMSFQETEYDERGRAWRRVWHKIDPANGESIDSLESLTWYDELGRVIKVRGEQLAKYRYDRLGQRTHEFVLASDENETAYADADDVDGDLVLEERQTVFDANHRPWMTVRIDRLYNNVGSGVTYGALDADVNGDLDELIKDDVNGRVQITAYWYDDLSREKARAVYGTNQVNPLVITNVDTFDRGSIGGTVPSRSGDVLVTTMSYGKDGQVAQVTDPMEIVAAYEYDDAGRKTAEIANYADGTAGGGTNDDEDQIVRYSYTDGLMVTLTADLPSGETDQVTTYTFGTVKGTGAGDSKIATSHLLQKVTYPDSEDSDDVVRFAYNAQGQEIWRKDQAGNVIETDYDPSGRSQARKATTIDSAFDDDVKLIQSAYDALGRIETVTQRASTSVDGTTGVPNGTVVDQVKYVYDGWGNLTNFRQDLDSAVGGSGYWEVAYAYAKATAGRNTLRRTQVTLPGNTVYKYHYRTGTASHDDKASRVTAVRDASDAELAGYLYNGSGHVVRTQLSEVGIFSKAYNGSGTTFGRLDRFNRTTISSWTRDLSTDREIYKVTLGYDPNSNITFQDDAVHTGHDVAYSNDNLNRLIDAEEGTWGGSSISSRTRQQTWRLNQTGNWNLDQLDLNGDGLYTGTGELDDTRTHNAANELLARDTNSSSPAEHTFAYDAAGNMTDDGKDYEYVWDAFYRLRRVYVRDTSQGKLVSEYWYNGLGYLVTRHQDTDADGDVDGSDVKFHTAYDERWRQVATFRGSDANPKEQFVYHCAGNGGYGGSSYIDSVVLRDRDMTNGWTGAADGTLEERTYYLQNWRADVVALVEPDGDGGAVMKEWVKYSAYGVPFALPAGDTNSDGVCDSTDDAQVTTWKDALAYDVRGDLNLDGVIDADDESLVAGAHQSLGRGVLTSSTVGNRKGYAGYEGDAKLSAKWHVRHRVLDSVLGRWLSRDPLGHGDGWSVVQYVNARPAIRVDPWGLYSDSTPGGHTGCQANACGKCYRVTCTTKRGSGFGFKSLDIPAGWTGGDEKDTKAFLEKTTRDNASYVAVKEIADKNKFTDGECSDTTNCSCSYNKSGAETGASAKQVPAGSAEMTDSRGTTAKATFNGKVAFDCKIQGYDCNSKTP